MARVVSFDEFYYCTDTDYIGTQCTASLTTSSLEIKILGKKPRNKNRTILLEDVTGCLVTKQRDSTGHSVFLSIYYYIVSQKSCRTDCRKRVQLLLRYDKLSLSENQDTIEKWRANIIAFARKNELTIFNDDSNCLVIPKLLIFVNPKSGRGKAVKTFESKVGPLFKEAEISFDLIITTSSEHCKQVIQELPNVKKYTGIIAVSGDGLLFEIYNGLIARSDWQFVCDIPVGIIPQGSGNGLARSLAYLNSEPYIPNPMLVGTLNILKLRTKEMDLCLVNTISHPTVCSVLSIGWGLLADIDIESERYRFIGEARFTVYAIMRILKLRTYQATLHYLPATDDEPSRDEEMIPLPPLNKPLPSEKWVTMKGKFTSIYSSTIPFIATDFCFAPESKLDDGIIWLMIIRAPVTKLQLTQMLLSTSDGTHVNHPWVQFIPVKAFRLIPEITDGNNSYVTIDGEQLKSQPVQVQVMPRKGRVFMR